MYVKEKIRFRNSKKQKLKSREKNNSLKNQIKLCELQKNFYQS